jgi:hypothetical protein
LSFSNDRGSFRAAPIAFLSQRLRVLPKTREVCLRARLLLLALPGNSGGALDDRVHLLLDEATEPLKVGEALLRFVERIAKRFGRPFVPPPCLVG